MSVFKNSYWLNSEVFSGIGSRKFPIKWIISNGCLLCFFFYSSLLKGQAWPDAYNVQKSITCIGCNVNLPTNATGNNATDYSSISVPLGIVSTITLDLDFPANQSAGTLISVWVEDPAGTFNILTGVSYQLMNNATNVANTGWTSIAVSGSPTQKILYTSGMQAFNRIRITLSGVLSVGKTLNVYSVMAGTVPLPVHFSAFTGKANGNAIELAWITDYEHLNDYFQVQRSVDRHYWKTVGRVDAGDEGNSLRTYQYTDINPEPGVAYYRLCQVDLDQTESFSRIIAVTYDAVLSSDLSGAQLIAYPNLVHPGQDIELKLANETYLPKTTTPVKGVVSDFSGKIWPCAAIARTENGYSFRLPSSLPAGVYMIQVQADNFQAACRVFIH